MEETDTIQSSISFKEFDIPAISSGNYIIIGNYRYIKHHFAETYVRDYEDCYYISDGYAYPMSLMIVEAYSIDNTDAIQRVQYIPDGVNPFRDISIIPLIIFIYRDDHYISFVFDKFINTFGEHCREFNNFTVEKRHKMIGYNTFITFNYCEQLGEYISIEYEGKQYVMYQIGTLPLQQTCELFKYELLDLTIYQFITLPVRIALYHNNHWYI